jgi:hypothetical protein
VSRAVLLLGLPQKFLRCGFARADCADGLGLSALLHAERADAADLLLVLTTYLAGGSVRMSQNTRRYVKGVEVTTRRSFTLDDDLAALERAQIELVTGASADTLKVSTPPGVTATLQPDPVKAAAPVAAPRIGPSAPPVAVSAVPKAVLPEKATPAEPLPKVRKARSSTGRPMTLPEASAQEIEIPSFTGRVMTLSEASAPPVAPPATVKPPMPARPAPITDTADLRAFLIRRMVDAADAHEACMYADRIMQATQLELDAEKVLNLTRRDTLRAVDLVGTP